MKKYFYIDRFNDQQGPFSVEELSSRNLITPTTPVWCDSMPDWTEAKNVAELSVVFSEARMTPPSPATPVASATRAQYAQEPRTTELKPDSWLAWSIAATVLCCPLLGIPGIVYAAKVDGLWNDGRHDEAREAAKTARMWTIISACSGVVVGVVYGLLMAFGMVAGSLSNM